MVRPDLQTRLTVAALRAVASLQAMFFVVARESAVHRTVAFSIALLAWLPARGPLAPGRRHLALGVVLGGVGAVNFWQHLAQSNVPFEWRLLQVAIVFGYMAMALAGVVGVIRRAAFPYALCLTLLMAVVLLVWEVVLPSDIRFRTPPGSVRWIGSLVPDPELGESYAPNSTLEIRYPRNLRGSFDTPDSMNARWQLELHEGNVATLRIGTDSARTMRVSTERSVGSASWHVQLDEPGLRVRARQRYELRFRARADSTRTMDVVASQAHAPWNSVGLFRSVSLTPSWQQFTDTMRASETDNNARIGFAIGASAIPVEIAQVELRTVDDQRPVLPEIRPEYSITFQMNNMGCRGRDYPLERDPATWRILALGDSYTLGVGVHESDTFSAQLEHALNQSTGRAPHRKAEVINCGVSGYATREERLLYEMKDSRYAPDVVVLTAVWNDDISYHEEVRRGYVAASGKFESLFYTWRALLRGQRVRRRAPVDYSAVTAELRRLHALCQANGARLVVMIFDINEDPRWVLLREAIAQGVLGTDVPVLQLKPLFRGRQYSEVVVDTLYDQHPNELAHKLAADSLRGFLHAHGLDGGEAR